MMLRCLLILLCLHAGICFAQTEDTGFVYQDTSLMAPVTTDDVVEKIDTAAYENNDSYIVDTSLHENTLTIPADTIRSMKNNKALAYGKNLDSLLIDYQNKLKGKEKPKEEEESSSLIADFFSSSITMYFFWILGIVFVCFVIYKMFFTEGFFKTGSKKLSSVIVEDDAEHFSEDANYDKLIQQAIAAANYRLAVRYYFLQTLQKLQSKGLLQIAPDKTNNEYLAELTGKPFKKDFAKLTRNYEYVWYGEFYIDQHNFDILQQQFKSFNPGN